MKDCLKPIHTSTLNPNNKTNSLLSSTIHSEKIGDYFKKITSAERKQQTLQETSGFIEIKRKKQFRHHEQRDDRHKNKNLERERERERKREKTKRNTKDNATNRKR